MVGVVIVGRHLAGGVRGGDGRLERDHRPGALGRAVEARQPQHARDVLPVPLALPDGACVLTQVPITIAEAETALHQDRAVVPLAVDAVLDGEPEDRRRGVGAGVERTDVGAHRAAEQPREGDDVAGAVDPGEQRRERGDAPRLDGGRVQEGGPEIPDLAPERARARRAGVVDDGRDLAARARVDVVTDRPALPAGGDHRGLQPRPVGVGEEVVAR